MCLFLQQNALVPDESEKVVLLVFVGKLVLLYIQPPEMKNMDTVAVYS